MNERSDTIFKVMINDCLENQELRDRWKASWWADKQAQLEYKENAGVNKFMLKKHTGTGQKEKSTLVKVDTSIVVFDPIYNFKTLYSGFAYVGFANPERNILSAISWYDEANRVSVLKTPEEGLTTGQDGNEWYEVRYHPMLPLSYTKSFSLREYQSTYDLNKLPFERILRTDKEMTDEAWEKLLSELKNGIHEEVLSKDEKIQKKYFEEGTTEFSLANVRLTVHYPDLSKEGVLVFNEKWDIRKVQGRR